MRARPLGSLLLATTLLGCGARPRPAASPADRGELLAYDAAAFAGTWRIGSRFASKPSAEAELAIDIGAEITVRFVSTGAGAFDIFVDGLAVKGHMGGEAIDQRISAADPGMAEALATPMSSLTLGAHGEVTGAPNPANPIARQGGDLVDTAVFLMPPTPEAPVAVGATWTASRLVPTSSDVPDVAAEITYRLAALEACPPPVDGRCARITSTADTGERTVTIDGEETRLRYTLEGDSVLQLGGALTEASARMTMLMTSGGMTLDLDGTMTYQRVSTSAR